MYSFRGGEDRMVRITMLNIFATTGVTLISQHNKFCMMNGTHECVWSLHWLTYPKGVHSFRYFPYENTIVVCSCINAFSLVIAIRHSMRTPNMYALSGNCNSQAKCIYA